MGTRRTGKKSQNDNVGEDDGQWQQAARDGMTALERFGAELEKMFNAPPGAPPPAAPATSAPAPPRSEPLTPDAAPSLGEIETELARVLAEEGIVVRGHDVARVVGLMSGRQISWER
jgi:hypothetical protein